MKVVVDTESEVFEVVGTFSHVEEDAVAFHVWETGELSYAPADCVVVTEGRRTRDGLVALRPPVRIRVSNPDERDRRFPGRATVEVVRDVKGLSDETLAEALFYAEIASRTDAEQILALRRETMRRALTAHDSEAVEALIQKTMYEAFSNLVCDSSFSSNGTIEGNSEDADAVVCFGLKLDLSIESADSYR